MSFEHAPVSKGFMLGIALSSILVGVFDVKHYFHLQLVPHLSKHHQYWRLATHLVAHSNSSDLLIAELLLYKLAVPVERRFGSVKFASFAVLSTLWSVAFEVIALIAFHRAGLNYIPSGPTALLFSIVYQYSRVIPSAYNFRVLGLALNSKSFNYLLALQLAVSHWPGSATAALIGLLTGQLFRSDLVGLKTWRLSSRVVRLSSKYLLPLVGSTRPPMRSSRALPSGEDDSDSLGAAALRVSSASLPGATPAALASRNRRRVGARNDDTLRASGPGAGSPGAGSDAGGQTGTFGAGAGSAGETGTGRAQEDQEGQRQHHRRQPSSVVREWVDELTGRADRAGVAGIRIPAEEDVQRLTSIFPDLSRETLVGALQRSSNVEEAVNMLLGEQR